MRIRVERRSCFFQCGDRLGAINGRKIQQEPVERLTGFQVVKEGFHRNSSSREHGHATLNLGIRVDNLLFHRFLLRHRALLRRTEIPCRKSQSSWTISVNVKDSGKDTIQEFQPQCPSVQDRGLHRKSNGNNANVCKKMRDHRIDLTHQPPSYCRRVQAMTVMGRTMGDLVATTSARSRSGSVARSASSAVVSPKCSRSGRTL